MPAKSTRPFRWGLAVTLFFVLWSVVAMAAEATPAPGQDPAKMADVKRMLKASGTEDAARQGAAMGAHMMAESMMRQNPNLDRQHVSTFAKAIAATMWEDIGPEMMEGFALAFDKRFTHDEIRQLIAYYETPLGRKIVRLLPELMREGQQMGVVVGQKWGQRFQGDKAYREAFMDRAMARLPQDVAARMRALQKPPAGGAAQGQAPPSQGQ